MSAIASFIYLPAAALDQLRTDYDQCLKEKGKSGTDYNGSGYLFTTLLPYLNGQGIDLMRSSSQAELAQELSGARDAAIFIFTPDQRARFLGRLSPGQFSAEQLRDYYNAFNETNEPDAGEAMLSGIEFLCRSLAGLDDASVAVLSIC
ncbi:MAG: hypothetical protein JO170_34885 [Verrucomicrobia bacterium]|nr:hypothetical protein [Verrucomicrobiota bacterium]